MVSGACLASSASTIGPSDVTMRTRTMPGAGFDAGWGAAGAAEAAASASSAKRNGRIGDDSGRIMVPRR
ncbi:hypothetical protein GCM10009087_23290 [Sphingomonas oligophenolica]